RLNPVIQLSALIRELCKQSRTINRHCPSVQVVSSLREEIHWRRSLRRRLSEVSFGRSLVCRGKCCSDFGKRTPGSRVQDQEGFFSFIVLWCLYCAIYTPPFLNSRSLLKASYL